MVGGRVTAVGSVRSSAWVEIVGVAGSGKSTLTDALAGHGADWRVADSLHTRAPAHWPYVLRALPSAARVARLGVREGPALTWDELKFVMYVTEWERFLRTHEIFGRGCTILDQGPVFALARLLWTEKPVTLTRRFEVWVEEMLERWSRSLTAILWLDAPADVLIGRINGRSQPHEAKGVAASTAADVVRRHRAAYDRLFDVLGRLGRPPVLSFDTSVVPVSAIADAVAAFIADGDRRKRVLQPEGNAGQHANGVISA